MLKKGFLELGFSKLDIERQERRGLPEIIYSPQKTLQQLKLIIKELKNYTKFVFLSKLEQKKYIYLKKFFPKLQYFKEAKLAFLGESKKTKKGYCLVVSAGTSDIGIAEEAAVFLELLGNFVERTYDIGVAGLHRIEPFKEKFKKAKVIIVVAGMDAALASVISGLSKAPVIAVPTSVGYGACFGGLSALLGMLNSCSLGVAVVNIDNGLGAGYLAHLINNL